MGALCDFSFVLEDSECSSFRGGRLRLSFSLVGPYEQICTLAEQTVLAV